MRLFAVLLIVLALPSCEALTGKEIGRLPVNALSTEDHSVVQHVELDLLQDSKLVFWSEMDLSYTQPLALRWQIRVLRDSTMVQGMELNPFDMNMTIGEVRSEINGNVNWRYTGRNGVFTTPEDGHYTVVARLIAPERSTITLRKAELVIKQ